MPTLPPATHARTHARCRASNSRGAASSCDCNDDVVKGDLCATLVRRRRSWRRSSERVCVVHSVNVCGLCTVLLRRCLIEERILAPSNWVLQRMKTCEGMHSRRRQPRPGEPEDGQRASICRPRPPCPYCMYCMFSRLLFAFGSLMSLHGLFEAQREGEEGTRERLREGRER